MKHHFFIILSLLFLLFSCSKNSEARLPSHECPEKGIYCKGNVLYSCNFNKAGIRVEKEIERCEDNQVCMQAECIKADCDEIIHCIQDESICLDASSYKTCGNYDNDICFEWSQPKSCKSDEKCEQGNCVLKCTPNCDGKTCGDDGCGGSCGSCETNNHCEAGQCESNTKVVLCDQSDAPEHASVESEEIAIVWLGDRWSEPSQCNWSCEAPYHRFFNSETERIICLSEMDTLPCNQENIPEDALATNELVHPVWIEDETLLEGGYWDSIPQCIWACPENISCLNQAGTKCLPKEKIDYCDGEDNNCDGLIDNLPQHQLAHSSCEASSSCFGKTFEEHRYIFCHNVFKNWQDSNAFCLSQHGFLATVETSEENDFITKNISNRYWIGYYQKTDAVDAPWYWASGSNSNFTYWPDNQPDNFQNKENCTEIANYTTGFWNDFRCDGSLNFVCEIACFPNCENKQCGSDGCGGTCGSCSDASCYEGACLETCPEGYHGDAGHCIKNTPCYNVNCGNDSHCEEQDDDSYLCVENTRRAPCLPSELPELAESIVENVDIHWIPDPNIPYQGHWETPPYCRWQCQENTCLNANQTGCHIIEETDICDGEDNNCDGVIDNLSGQVAHTACDPSGTCFAKIKNNHKYIFCHQAKPWNDANSFCQTRFNGHLVSIENEEEENFIKSNMAQDTFIGLYQENDDDNASWLWANQSNSSHRNWTDGEPNNSCRYRPFISCKRRENCAEIYIGGKWNDTDCEESNHFVCEIAP